MKEDVREALKKHGFKSWMTGSFVLNLDHEISTACSIMRGKWSWLCIECHDATLKADGPVMFTLCIGSEHIDLLTFMQNEVLEDSAKVVHKVAETALDIVSKANARLAELAMTGM